MGKSDIKRAYVSFDLKHLREAAFFLFSYKACICFQSFLDVSELQSVFFLNLFPLHLYIPNDHALIRTCLHETIKFSDL